jgi:RNA polymerase sigma-70 factor, ECF subfamily
MAAETRSFDEDVTLMIAFQEGDEGAFDTLFRRHARLLLGFFWRATGSRTAGEELVQETFLKIHRYKASYEPRAAFRTYLFTVARSILQDNWRRMQKRRAERSLERAPEPVAQSIDPERAAASRETLRKVESAVTELPENQRTALLLVRYEGLSYDEAAATMGVTVVALKSLLNRARKHLIHKVRR